MRELKRDDIPTPARGGLIVVAVVVGLMLTLAVVVAGSGPSFEDLEKIGPDYARPGDVITYTIVAVNTGNSSVEDVVLSDTLPNGVEFVTDSCTYDDDYAVRGCGPLNEMWDRDFLPSTRITTTFAVTVTTSTLKALLVNHAYLSWDSQQKETVFTTTVLPAIPYFGESYKIGHPQEVKQGDVIAYTVVAVNTGDPVGDPEQPVVLSDALPSGVEFIPDSCHYDVSFGEGAVNVPCGEPPELWQIDDAFEAGRITTTFAVTVTEEAAAGPLVNYAYLAWEVIQEPMSGTITVKTAVHLPLILRNHPPRPEGSVVIADGTPSVYRPSVILDLSADFEEGIDTVVKMRLRNDGEDWHEWEDYATIKSWELDGGTSGLRRVYVQFRGSKGGISDAVYDEIYLSRNGDFEFGAVQPGWQGLENPLPVSIVQDVQERTGGSTPPADGSYAVLLGDTTYPCESDGVPLGYAAIEQTFKVPSRADKLTFKYVIWSQDASVSKDYDRFEVKVNGDLRFADGNQVNDLGCSKWWRVPGPDNPRDGQTDGWATGEIDLSAYAGQSVTLSFRNYSRYDGWYNTYTYIDRVTIEGDW